MADVFISYHMKSAGEIVKQIAAALKDVGVSCWYAKRDLTAPGAFAATITREIRACKVFLLVLNEGSNLSEHVKNEVSLAFERISKHEAMPLICFKTDNCTLSDEMAYYLHRQQITDGNPPDQEHIQALSEQIADSLNCFPTWQMIWERNQRIRELEQAYQKAHILYKEVLKMAVLVTLISIPDSAYTELPDGGYDALFEPMDDLDDELNEYIEDGQENDFDNLSSAMGCIYGADDIESLRKARNEMLSALSDMVDHIQEFLESRTP